MFSTGGMPSPSSMISAYASLATSVMLFRSLANDLIPSPLRGYLFMVLHSLFKRQSPDLTLVIEESSGIARNQVFDAAETYLCSKVSPNTTRLKISKSENEKKLAIKLERGEKIVDLFEGVELKWRFVCVEPENDDSGANHRSRRQSSGVEKRLFELSFDKKHKELVMESYIPYVIDKAKSMKDQKRVLKMHTLHTKYFGSGIQWDAINLEHPSTFETLAMEPEVKNSVIEDLDRFVKRKEFYKKVGRAWKRGYLLYGPPGTGKSSLVAAMANHLKFDIYDLQLPNIMADSDLRSLLLATGNRSILVIEDIDCSVDLPDRRNNDVTPPTRQKRDVQLTLSGLLNFIDGLWSSCGDERIIVFTTNHKERLDPALLRPGRMDMHVHMSYCTSNGFKILASNYLGITNGHDNKLFQEVEGLIDNVEVSPAQVAEELMKCEDPNVALGGLVNVLKRKKVEGSELVNEGGNTNGNGQNLVNGGESTNGIGFQKPKRRKIQNSKPRTRSSWKKRSRV